MFQALSQADGVMAKQLTAISQFNMSCAEQAALLRQENDWHLTDVVVGLGRRCARRLCA